ncbi:MAG: hypothetical protein RQ824_01860 [bacterium]|nr:hypothetical protein [bacterium]
MKKTKTILCDWKCMLTICTVLLSVTLVDAKFNMDKNRQLVIDQVKNWTYLYGESVRISLNNLMREGKMSSRFDLLDSMKEELTGLQEIRVIRDRKVDELFRKVAEEEVVPIEREAIGRMTTELARYEEELKGVSDPDEREELLYEIADIKGNIARKEMRIVAALSQRESDSRDTPKDELDMEVLGKGVPVYHFQDNNARVLIPYLVKKRGCAEASGCHRHAKEGDVLGAVSMEFSMEELNKSITSNGIKLAGFEAIKLGMVFAFILLYVIFIYRQNILKEASN